MKHVIYTPDEDDNRVVTVFGLTFKAGSSVAVDDDVYAKLSENPTFKKGGAPKAAEKNDEVDASEVMNRKPAKVDGRSKAARAAKGEDDAAVRAKAHQADLEEAKAEEAEDDVKAKH